HADLYSLSLHDALPIFGPDHLPRREASKAARWRSHLGSRAIFRRPGSVRGIFSAVVIYKRYSWMAGAKCSRVMNWQMRAGETCPDRKSTRLNPSHTQI